MLTNEHNPWPPGAQTDSEQQDDDELADEGPFKEKRVGHLWKWSRARYKEKDRTTSAVASRRQQETKNLKGDVWLEAAVFY